MGFSLLKETGELVKVCKSVNITLARFVKNFKENLSIGDTESKLSKIRGNPTGVFESGTTKQALSDVKPLIEGHTKV